MSCMLGICCGLKNCMCGIFGCILMCLLCPMKCCLKICSPCINCMSCCLMKLNCCRIECGLPCLNPPGCVWIFPCKLCGFGITCPYSCFSCGCKHFCKMPK